MKLFKYYRILFVLSFVILLTGSILKITHTDISQNATTFIYVGLFILLVCVAIAFFLIYKSKKMPAGEKLIWVMCFALGFIFNVGIISFTTALIFFIIAPSRLFYKDTKVTNNLKSS